MTHRIHLVAEDFLNFLPENFPRSRVFGMSMAVFSPEK
jgi:hypothetical protein